jgi:hypothetical protein
MADIKIKDAPLVKELGGAYKIPISDGSSAPKTVSIDMLRTYIEPRNFNEDFNKDFTI